MSSPVISSSRTTSLNFQVVPLLEKHNSCVTTLVCYYMSCMSSADTSCMIPLTWLSNQGICAKMESVKEICHVNYLIRKAAVMFFHVGGTFKCCVGEAWCGERGIQTPGSRSVSLSGSRQSQRCFPIQSETSCDTSTLGWGMRGSKATALIAEPNRSPNPRDTQTKIKGVFFLFLFPWRGRILSSLCYPPADVAAEQGKEQKTA